MAGLVLPGRSPVQESVAVAREASAGEDDGMATAGHDRHAGGRPPKIKALTPFGHVLNPVLVDRGWNVYILGEETGLLPHTIWWWMKKAKKWPWKKSWPHPMAYAWKGRARNVG